MFSECYTRGMCDLDRPRKNERAMPLAAVATPQSCMLVAFANVEIHATERNGESSLPGRDTGIFCRKSRKLVEA